MSVIGTAPVFARSSPGTYVTISEPGENPSARFQSVGSIGLPATLRGIEVRSNATRRPVGVERSGFVKKSLGNGSMQAEGSIGSQPDANEGTVPTVAARVSAASTAVRSRMQPKTIGTPETC